MKKFFAVICAVISFTALTISCSPGLEHVGRWERFELTFRGEVGRNPFRDVTLGAVFSGAERRERFGGWFLCRRW